MMGAVKRAEQKLWPLKLHYFLHGAGKFKTFENFPKIYFKIRPV
jgi:hypothetical protein